MLSTGLTKAACQERACLGCQGEPVVDQYAVGCADALCFFTQPAVLTIETVAASEEPLSSSWPSLGETKEVQQKKKRSNSNGESGSQVRHRLSLQ